MNIEFNKFEVTLVDKPKHDYRLLDYHQNTAKCATAALSSKTIWHLNAYSSVNYNVFLVILPQLLIRRLFVNKMPWDYCFNITIINTIARITLLKTNF